MEHSVNKTTNYCATKSTINYWVKDKEQHNKKYQYTKDKL